MAFSFRLSLSIVTFSLFLSSKKCFTAPSKKWHFVSCESCLPTPLRGFSGFLNCRLPCLPHQSFSACPNGMVSCHQRGNHLFSLQRLPLNPHFKRQERAKQANSSLLSSHNLLTERNILKQVKQTQSVTDREGIGRSGHLDLLDELPYISVYALVICYRISLTEFTVAFAELYLKKIKEAQSQKLPRENSGNVRSTN